MTQISDTLSDKKSCMKTYLSHHNFKMLWPPNRKLETVWMFFYDKHKSLLLAKLCYPVRQQQPAYCSIHKIEFIFILFFPPSLQTLSSSPQWEYRRMRMKLTTWDFHKQIFLSNYHPNSSCWQQIWNENLLTSYDSSKNCFHPNNYCKKVKGVLAEFRLVS